MPWDAPSGPQEKIPSCPSFLFPETPSSKTAAGREPGNRSAVYTKLRSLRRQFLYVEIASNFWRNLYLFLLKKQQKSKNPHQNNLFIFRFFQKIIVMRIFIFLIFFCLQKNTFLTEINGVFIFSCFAFFSKIIPSGIYMFLLSFLVQKKYVFNPKQ